MTANDTSASLHHCMGDRTTIYLHTALSICRTLLHLPLCILILHHAQRQWQKQRSFASASHSDFFTYHLVVIELISMLGYLFFYCGTYTNFATLTSAGYSVSSVACYGELFFHVLTCVEHYLAVVHPVTYQGLRNARGVKIRNMSTACAWLLTISSVCGDVGLHPISQMQKSGSSMFLCLLVILFCSLSVVYVLIRPPPRDFRKHKDKLNQSRKRALHMMLMILGVLCLSLLGLLIAIFLINSFPNICYLMASALWLDLPSSLVLPLLYLYRRGNLSWVFSSKMSDRG